MGKYAALIDNLAGGPKEKGQLYFTAVETLQRADRRAFQPLVRALKSHPDAVTREVVAEILGDRMDVLAIPHLVAAVEDPDECTRMDAIWSIERILGFRPGYLQGWLDIDLSDPEGNQKKLRRFLRRNQEYLDNLSIS